MIIAVDASGGDYAPVEVVKGAIKAAEEYQVEIALVGPKSMLHVLGGRNTKKLDITFIEAPDVIDFHESPMRAIQNKPNSSIVVGINLVREGKAAAFVSAGHSGAVFGAALLRLGKIVERPAIGTTIMIGTAPFLLIDAGANVDCRPNHLVQFAQMGSIYARSILEIESPRVAILSNGEEESKGNRAAKQAHQMLKQSNLNFIGNIEGHDLPRGRADVVVTDGFTGNIVLKTLEGMGDTIQTLQIQLGQALDDAAHLPARLTSHILGMGTLAKRMDYKERGGACLLGVNGNIIIAHGRSQAKAMKNAIGLAKRTAEQDLVNVIKNGKL